MAQGHRQNKLSKMARLLCFHPPSEDINDPAPRIRHLSPILNQRQTASPPAYPSTNLEPPPPYTILAEDLNIQLRDGFSIHAETIECGHYPGTCDCAERERYGSAPMFRPVR